MHHAVHYAVLQISSYHPATLSIAPPRKTQGKINSQTLAASQPALFCFVCDDILHRKSPSVFTQFNPHVLMQKLKAS